MAWEAWKWSQERRKNELASSVLVTSTYGGRGGPIQDSTNKDVVEDSDEAAQVLVDALVENNTLELLVQNLARLDKGDPDESAAVYTMIKTMDVSRIQKTTHRNPRRGLGLGLFYMHGKEIIDRLK